MYFFTFSKCDLDSFCLENIDSLKEFLDLRKSSVKVGQVTFFSIFSTLVSSIFRDKCWTAYCICQPYILRRNIHKNKKKKSWTTSNGGEETTRRVNYGKFTKNPWKLNHHLLSKMSVKCNSTTIKWCAEKQVSCARLLFN